MLEKPSKHANNKATFMTFSSMPRKSNTHTTRTEVNALTLLWQPFRPHRRNVIHDFACRRRLCSDFPLDRFSVVVWIGRCMRSLDPNPIERRKRKIETPTLITFEKKIEFKMWNTLHNSCGIKITQ